MDLNKLFYKTSLNVFLSINNITNNGVWACKLARIVDTSVCHVMKILKKFEKVGLIKRIENENDRRTKNIELTPFGKEVWNNLNEIKKLITSEEINEK